MTPHPLHNLWRRCAAPLAVAIVASTLTFVASPAPSAEAATIRPFGLRANFNTTGVLTNIGNAVLTCPIAGVTRMNTTTLTPVSDPACATTQTNQVPSQNGATKFTNNQFTMQWIDIDGSAPQPLQAGGTVSTFNSSTSQLVLNPGASVLWAGLYWNADTAVGGTVTPPTGITPVAAPSEAARGTVLFRTPGDTGYRPITATQVDAINGGGSRVYNAFANVTTLVQAQNGGTTGTYTAANIQAATGSNRYGGWALVVVIRDPAEPIRNLTVFDGYARVAGGGDRVDVTASGFSTPTSGTVNARVGAVAWDGDRRNTGDQLLLNNVVLSTSLRPANDFFNSTISQFNTYNTTNNPAYTNNLGVDLVRVDSSGILPNASTSATVSMTTGGETVDLSVLTFTVALYAPQLDAVKSGVDLNGGSVRPGDVLEYTVNVTNTGLDSSSNSRFVDAIPAGSTYVPGSIKINGSARTDAAGDDSAEFAVVSGAPSVVGRLGTGATAANGGAIAVNGTATVTFRVTVGDVANNTVISNQANFSYVATVSGTALDGVSNAVDFTVDNPKADLSIVKTPDTTPMVAGTSTSYTIAVTNNGPDTAAAPISVTDTIPPPLTYTGFTGTGWVCTAGAVTGAGTPVTCTRSSALAAAVSAPNLQLQVSVPSGTTVTSLTNVANVTSPTPEPAGATLNNTSSALTTLQAQADLAIAKTLDSTPVIAGRPISFTLAPRNLGPSTASAGAGQTVTVVDTLPVGLTFVSATGSGWSCAAGAVTGAGTPVTCTRPGPVAPGAAMPPISVAATVAGGAVNVVTTNTATISSPTAQPPNSTANDTASVTFTPTASTDLALAKAASGAFNPGQGGTFTLTVANNGPSALVAGQTVVVNDPLPTGLTLNTATGAPWACTGTTTVNCTYTVPAGGVPAGGSFALALAVNVAPSTPNSVVNTASLVNPPNDPISANNTASVATDVTVAADLGVTKSLVGTLNAGRSATYRFVVTNAVGGSNAPATTVTDTLPAGLTFVSSTPSGCTAAGQTVSCPLGTLNAGASATIDVVVDVAAAVTGTVTNTATVASSIPDPAPGNNTSTASSPAVVEADLEATKTPGTSAFTAGGTGTYTVRLTNRGPAAAPGTAVVDTLPAGMTVIDYSAPAGVTCTPASPLPPTGVSSLTCNLASPLQPLTSVDIVLTVRVDASVPDGTVLINRVSATSSVTDPDPNNNSGIGGPVTVIARADLSIIKTDSGPITAGANTAYTLAVSNAGPSVAAAPVTITDDLPSGLTFVAGSGTGWTCAPSGQRVTCTLAGTLGVGAAPPITITAAARPGLTGPVVNTAVVASPTPDPAGATADNTSSVTTPVLAVADLVGSKRALDPAVAGDTMRFEISLTNVGPSAAAGPITLTDTVGPGLTLVSLASGDPLWDCVVATCTYSGTIPLNGNAPPVIATALVSATAAGDVVNSATATAPATDPNPDDNTNFGTSVPITRRADLSVLKAVTPATLTAGAPATYTVTVTNNGPSALLGGTVLTVTDVLPADVTLTGSTAPWTCAGTTTLTCTRTLSSALPAGGTSELTLPVTVGATLASTPVVNRATVLVPAGVTDPDPTDNSTTNTAPLVTSADLALTKTAGTSTITAGSTGTYELRVTNIGPSRAEGPIRIVDTLPPGLSLVSASAPWSCVASLPTVDCTLSTELAVGPAPVLTLTVAADSELTAGTLLTNTAIASSATPDPVAANDTSSAPTTVVNTATLAVSKTRQGAVVAGSTASWVVGVRNNGPSLARSPITVTDLLPTGFQFSSATAPWACDATDPARPVCTLARNLAVGEVAPALVISATVPATGVSASVTNTVQITSATSPGSPVSATDVGPVVARNDLTIVKDLLAPVVGAPATFTFVVTNLGPSQLAAGETVTVTDDLSLVGKTFANSTGSGAGWSCGAGPPTVCTYTVPTGGIAVDGALPQLRITTVENLTAADATRINSATVDSTAIDPTSTNNTATAPLTATTRADVGIVKTGGATVVAGGTTSYTLTITNNGPSPAEGVRVVDALPGALTIVSLAGATCLVPVVVGSTTLDCTLGTVAVGAPVVLTLTVAAPVSANASTLTNLASVTSDTVDSNPLNDSSDTLTAVTRSADLVVSKAVSGPLGAGTTGTYVITVANPTGPSDARQASVFDELPAGLSVVSVAGTGPFAGCAAPVGALSITCVASGPLAVGSINTITVAVAIRPGVVGPVTNDAQASSTTPDPDAANSTGTTTDPVARTADLDLGKVVVGPVVGGRTITYELVARNLGPSAVLATDVTTITDIVPLDILGPITAVGSGWTCTVSPTTTAGTPVSCALNALDPIAVGASTNSIQITGTLNPSATEPITNAASVSLSGATTDPTPGNDTASVTATITGSADLSIVKTLESPLVPGRPATYRLRITNAGPSSSQPAINISDLLPSSLSFVSAAGTDTNCSAVGQQVTCTRTTPLAAGATLDITLVANLDAAATAAVVNTAEIVPPIATSDPNQANNTSTTTDIPVPAADLQARKAVSPSAAIAGTQAVYLLSVVNNGPSVAAAPVSITDTLPAGLTFLSAPSASGWTCAASGQTVNCQQGSPIPVGATGEIAINVLVEPTVPAGTVLINSAVATSPTADPTPGNDTATAPITVGVAADLAVTKVHAPEPFVQGDPGAYTVTVSNNGPSTIAAGTVLTVTDTLPPGQTLSGITAPWTCTPVGAGTVISPQVLTCTLTLSTPLALNGTLTLPIPVAVDGAIDPGAVANSVTVDPAPGYPDPLSVNNTDTDRATVVGRADLSVIKTNNPSTFTAGEPATYTIAVTNNGPSSAQNVVLTDVLPVGITVAAVTDPDFTCGTPTGTFTCTRPSIAAGATVALTLEVTVLPGTAAQVLRNTANVRSDIPDPTPGNDTATNETQVLTLSDVSLGKTATTASPVAGATFGYTFTITNAGPSNTGRPLVVTDTLPAGMTFLPSAGCTAAGQVVTCTVDEDLAPLTSRAVTVGVQLDPGVGGATIGAPLTNNASLVAPTADPDIPNLADTTVTPIARADLEVEKRVVGSGPFLPGNDITYAITVTNAGPSNAAAPVVTDVLPPTLRFVSAGGAGWSCSAGVVTVAGTPVTCNASGSLPAPAAGISTPVTSGVITIVATIDPAASGIITNTANVDSATPEPPGGSRAPSTASAGPLEPRSDLAITKTALGAAIAGQSAAFAITVTNNGPSVRSASIELTDTLVNPSLSGLVFDVAAGWTCIDTNPLTAAPVVCTTGADLAPGESAPTLTARADVAANAASGNAPANQVTLTPSVLAPDPVPGNDVATAPLSISPLTDLTITKDTRNSSGVNGPIAAGETGQYVITVANNGPSTYRAGSSFRVVDTLPPGLSVTGPAPTGSGWDCGTVFPLVNEITCTQNLAADLLPTTLAPLAVAPALVLPVRLAADVVAATTTNSVQVFSAPEFPDPVALNDTASDTVGVFTQADVVLRKRIGSPFVVPGLPYIYTLLVNNNGPSQAALPVVVTDLLPPGIEYLSTGDTGGNPWTCSVVAGDLVDGQQVDCVRATALPVTGNTAETIPLNVRLLPSIVDPIVTNVVTGGSRTTTDPSPGTNTFFVDSPVQPQADLAIAKSLTSAPLVAGAPETYDITVTNLGPSDAAGPLTVLDSLPAGMSFVGASGDGWSCVDGTPVVCTRSNGIPGPGTGAPASTTFTLTVTTPSGSAGAVLDNTASVSSPTSEVLDPDTGLPTTLANNTVTTPSATVVARADLSMQKLLRSTVVAGATADYRLTVTNNGPSDAVDVVVTDTLPAGMTLAGGDLRCAGVGTSTATCTVGAMVAFAVVVIDVVVQVAPSASGLLRNTATATSATTDLLPDNDSAYVDAVIGLSADIRLTKTVTTAPVVAGLPVTFQLTATNAGPSPATNVAITDTLPAGLTFVSSTPAGCTAIDQTVSCPVGDLAPTISATFDIVARVDPAAVGATSNTAEVTADTPDPDSSDASNRPTAPFTVTAVADLTVTKVANTDPVVPGLTASWRITVSNAGPSVAASATVDDPLPAGATATTGTDARCTGSTALACALGDLAVGASTTLDVVASVAPGAVGSLINTATASSLASDPTAAASSATVALASRVNRSVRMTPRSTSVVAGDPITVDISVGNVGPSDSAATVVRIPVPAGATFTSGDPRCALQGVEVVCTIGVVAPGATVDLAVVFTTDPNRPSPIAFTATVSGDSIDSDASDDTASASVAITPRTIALDVRGECRNDVPWLVHTVTGNFAFTSVTLRLAGVDLVTRETRVVGPTGAQLWPGAAADAAGNGTDWPGWILQGGQWVQGDDGFTWVRPTMQVTAEVNPTATTTLSYPLACADPVELTLPDTGGNSESPAQLALALLVAGVALVSIARQRRRSITP